MQLDYLSFVLSALLVLLTVRSTKTFDDSNKGGRQGYGPACAQWGCCRCATMAGRLCVPPPAHPCVHLHHPTSWPTQLTNYLQQCRA